MRHRFRHRHRPPWWPDNEPWPPHSDDVLWRRRRRGFVRRIAVAFALFYFLSLLGAGSLVSMLAGTQALGDHPFRGGPIAIASLSVLFAAALVAVTIRRIGVPMGEVVEAANRLATGDYAARVTEYGPRSLRTVGRAFNSMASRLEAQDRVRRDLMADIAHELRTPLSVMQGRIEGLIDGVYAADQAQLARLLDDTKVLARLVDDLRTLAHAESGTLTLQRELTDVAVLAQQVVDAFQADAVERRITVRLDAASDLPLASVDPLRVREILTNLVSNALRYTPAGGAVTVSMAAEGDRIVATVSDNGSGIPAEELPKIFDRFYKGSGSGGSGLGLTIARNLVIAHGGEIKAESEPGRGTKVTFSLKV
jgi:signal transduction histidine kinase